MLRWIGILKAAAVLLVDFALMYGLLGWETALFLCGLVALYGWLGEYLALVKDGAIRLERLNVPERTRLAFVRGDVIEDVKRVSGIDISDLRLSLIPSDKLNAYAYGLRNVAMTRALLTSCDDTTLCAVLGHEVSHVLQADAVFHRLIFANVTLALAALTIASFVSVSVLGIIFALLCAFGICRGLGSVLLFQGAGKLVKGVFTAAQHLLLFCYQAVMGLASRHCEFRADSYSCQLGYAPQMCYYLSRFAGSGEPGQRSLQEILYASHPAPDKRILRIEQHSANS